MTSEQLAAIERLRELEKKATPGEWWVDESGEICTAVPLDKNNQVDKQNIVNQAFICALRNKAFPLLQEMQAEIEYLKSEDQRTDRAFSKALKDLVLAKRESKRFGNQMVLAVNKNCELQAENERLRELIKDACTDLGRMTLLRDKFYCEMETAQTETVFAKKEIERLRAGITVAAFAESGAKNADSVREMIGAVNSIEKSLKEAQAERDALQARIDGALAMLDEQSGNPFGSQYYNEEIEFYEGLRESLQRLLSGKSDRYLRSVEILAGEGENGA